MTKSGARWSNRPAQVIYSSKKILGGEPQHPVSTRPLSVGRDAAISFSVFFPSPHDLLLWRWNVLLLKFWEVKFKAQSQRPSPWRDRETKSPLLRLQGRRADGSCREVFGGGFYVQILVWQVQMGDKRRQHTDFSKWRKTQMHEQKNAPDYKQLLVPSEIYDATTNTRNSANIFLNNCGPLQFYFNSWDFSRTKFIYSKCTRQKSQYPSFHNNKCLTVINGFSQESSYLYRN